MKWFAPIFALVICYAIFFAYVVSSYDDLPLRLATHFNLEGRPNGWMSRDGFVEFSIGFCTLMPAFIVGVMSMTGWIPVSFVNLPHRDYWLAPERRKATSALLLRYALWFACMNVLFITGVHWMVVQANDPIHGVRLSGLGMVFVAGTFLLGTGIWVSLVVQRFNKTDAL